MLHKRKTKVLREADGREGEGEQAKVEEYLM